MMTGAKIFGAALDALDSPERLYLKLSYLRSLERELINDRIQDPYDAIRGFVTKGDPVFEESAWFGKIDIDTWLTPRPNLSDLEQITVENFGRFLSGNGCLHQALRLRDYVLKEILPSRPVMIGVDHSLTGGVILALKNLYENLNVVILDAHFDGVAYQYRKLRGDSREAQFHSANNQDAGEELIKFYECGNFLSWLLEEGILEPGNLWVLGVQDELGEAVKCGCIKKKARSLQTEEFRKWVREGVNLVTKSDLISNTFPLDLAGPVYLSVDMDVGSLASVYSARFMNCIGLGYEELVKALLNLSHVFDSCGVQLVGLDIMEIDIHFLESTEISSNSDRCKDLAKEILKTFRPYLEEEAEMVCVRDYWERTG